MRDVVGARFDVQMLVTVEVDSEDVRLIVEAVIPEMEA